MVKVSALVIIFVVGATVASLLESGRLLVAADDCPLDMTWSNFSWAASACSSKNERSKCCRYLNAFITVSVSRYAKTTDNLGVPAALNDVCLNYVTQTFVSYGIPHNATLFCGIGPKIHVSYQCQGMTRGSEFLLSLNFEDVIQNCKLPLGTESSCRRCLNSSIIYLHHLIGGQDNVTLNTCRDAAFVALTIQDDNVSAIDLASCFFSIKELQILPVIAPQPSFQQISPAIAPAIVSAEAPLQQLTNFSLRQHHGTLLPALVPVIGFMATGLTIVLVIVLILCIRKKARELKTVFHQPHVHKYQEDPSIVYKRFSYNEIKKATNNFSNIIGRGGYGTVYKAQFDDGCIAAVKRMNQVSELGKYDFCREVKLISKLHHRHIVAFRGFCVERCERFLIYEYMENGSLRDYLLSSDKTPLTWQARIQIAIDVANALPSTTANACYQHANYLLTWRLYVSHHHPLLASCTEEYLHFYCDPPMCHGDIKPSNILLDKNFLAKVADFGLAHASTRDESVATFLNLYTPGGEYGGLTEKSDVYGYGMLLLQLVSGKCDSEVADSRPLDPKLGDAIDEEQLQAVVGIVRQCTQREGSARPSIKQVLRQMYRRLAFAGFSLPIEQDDDDDKYGRACLQSSSSSISFGSRRSLLLPNSSPLSPDGITSA